MRSNLIRIMLPLVLLLNSCSTLIQDRGLVTGSDVWITIKHRGVWVSYPSPRRKTRHLPSICAEYYNDGTERWINCMGVEKK